MADIQDWQRQNMSKGGQPEAAPSQMNPKTWGGPASSMNSKIAKATHPCGGMVKGMADGGMADRSVTSPTDGWAAHGSRKFGKRGYADGGEVTEASDKAAGLKASSGEEVGFFKRLAMGNIDQEGSEAYNKFGAGRGAAERVKALPDDSSNDMAESKRLGMKTEASEPAKTTPLETPEPVKTTAADFQRTDKDTTPVAAPAKSKPASAAKASSNTQKADPSTSVVRIQPNTAKDAFDPAGINFGRMSAPAKTAARTIKTKSEMLGSSKAR